MLASTFGNEKKKKVYESQRPHASTEHKFMNQRLPGSPPSSNSLSKSSSLPLNACTLSSTSRFPGFSPSPPSLSAASCLQPPFCPWSWLGNPPCWCPLLAPSSSSSSMSKVVISPAPWPFLCVWPFSGSGSTPWGLGSNGAGLRPDCPQDGPCAESLDGRWPSP
ncbi:hypothetical protein DUNSADRAFT_1923 [Dunaliella salina]|uniref:Encoded protein n=1 Tax=Dunaliella salina TaxID=3046 RepID=A0ABQ7FWU8_DUNSA|nr:hypothetical protein DUNSADRAFT_1923 [Dunaliella salina]|eukprot:KAF5826837.1 hypothetical protein DUNSADRAFT_1923 [Dunaliella salina]